MAVDGMQSTEGLWMNDNTLMVQRLRSQFTGNEKFRKRRKLLRITRKTDLWQPPSNQLRFTKEYSKWEITHIFSEGSLARLVACPCCSADSVPPILSRLQVGSQPPALPKQQCLAQSKTGACSAEISDPLAALISSPERLASGSLAPATTFISQGAAPGNTEEHHLCSLTTVGDGHVHCRIESIWRAPCNLSEVTASPWLVQSICESSQQSHWLNANGCSTQRTMMLVCSDSTMKKQEGGGETGL